MTLHDVAQAKARAKALRQTLATLGTAISHAQALELVAHQNGARNWNTLHAELTRPKPDPQPDPQPLPFALHQRVQGHYLGQPFTGEIRALAQAGDGYRVALRLDAPVDTVTFDSFSNFRRHLRGLINREGISPRKTSDGTPHLILKPLKAAP